MTVLLEYQQFQGLHWETGTVRNALDYMGVKAPHTGEAYSEAMLMGISGGAVMGYFSFAYEGYDPQCRILTRSTFDPMDTLLSRMGVIQHVFQTTNPEKAERNLERVLSDGFPAIVWADMFTLPYNALPEDDGMWAMLPILVYGIEHAANQVYIADRAHVPIHITADELADARGRVKKHKYKLITIGPPDEGKIISAVRLGIQNCLQLYTEKPLKGASHNFGLQAYEHWQKLLTRPKTRLSWAKEFPPGVKMYAGLTSAFTDINTFGKQGNAERDVFANFLEEAALLLDLPDLKSVAVIFREAAQAWAQLSLALLSDDVDAFQRTRQLLLKRHQAFLHRGGTATHEMQAIDRELSSLRAEMGTKFPLNPADVDTFRMRLAEHVAEVARIEARAVVKLKQIFPE
ncbi:MAG: BtrH N-terminal domain-containing protein [Anaerolineales bacterium]|jgi:hypothetical protein